MLKNIETCRKVRYLVGKRLHVEPIQNDKRFRMSYSVTMHNIKKMSHKDEIKIDLHDDGLLSGKFNLQFIRFHILVPFVKVIKTIILKRL